LDSNLVITLDLTNSNRLVFWIPFPPRHAIISRVKIERSEVFPEFFATLEFAKELIILVVIRWNFTGDVKYFA
jgi:hypothetical protein